MVFKSWSLPVLKMFRGITNYGVKYLKWSGYYCTYEVGTKLSNYDVSSGIGYI